MYPTSEIRKGVNRMKKFKRLGLILSLVLCVSLLSGCMGVVAEVDINSDGSGTMSAFMGISEKGLTMQEEMGGDSVSLEDYEKLEYNGITYYGETQTASFSSVDEFNFLVNDLSETEGDINSVAIVLVKNSDSSFTLNFTVSPETGDTTSMEESMKESMAGSMGDVDMEEMAALLEEMTLIYTFNFPSAVKQISGDTKGITISDNTLTIDIMGLTDVETDTVYTFTTSTTSDVVESPIYSDVDVNAWYYPAVKTMTAQGLLVGVGNNKFGPNGDITYSQFSQILARADGAKTGAENGYWAYDAIEYCVEKGYIFNRGEITPANYDMGMTREAAIYGMVQYQKGRLTNYLDEIANSSITSDSIPDFNSISDKYQDAVLDGYKMGITSGVSNDMTFAPTMILTRAQVCQLFYNLEK